MPYSDEFFTLRRRFGGIGAGPSSLPGWVTSLAPYEWYSIPNTALSSIAPSPTPLGITGPSTKINGWCGATLKRIGSIYMLGAAGGHGDYAGNEVDALPLNTSTPQWEQKHAPSANADIINDPAQFYLDLRPSSTHTYYATHFIEARNRMFVIASPGISGSFPAMPGGWAYTGSQRSFSYSWTEQEWDSPDYVALYTGGGDFTAALTVKHQTTDDIYMTRYSSGWWKWTQVSNTWNQISTNNDVGNYAGGAVDPTRNRILAVGDFNGTQDPRVWDLNGQTVSATFGGLGASSLRMSGYPGVIYDEANDKFLVFYNSGGSVEIRRVNASTWSVDDPTVTGTKPAARTNGIQNSVQYVPELGGAVIANDYSGNVKFIRLS